MHNVETIESQLIHLDNEDGLIFFFVFTIFFQISTIELFKVEWMSKCDPGMRKISRPMRPMPINDRRCNRASSSSPIINTASSIDEIITSDLMN